MSNNEAKWKTNQEKVSFLKQFPGLIHSWDEAKGLTVQSIIPLEPNSKIALIVFSNGSFTLSHTPETEPKYLREGVETARTVLEPIHPEAYVRYDDLADRDKEAARVVRLENILGAIHNNLEQIPELKDRIRLLVKKWNP